MAVRPVFPLEVGGRTIHLGERTLVLGVLNVTPDSFSDGGQYADPQRAIEHGVEMVREGADGIDVGGESTRPGSQPVSAGEELRRVLPVIEGLRQARGLRQDDPLARRLRAVPISIDTTKAVVAEQAARAGATMINDVSGLRFDPDIADVSRRFRTPLVLMHLRGRPQTMQSRPFARDIWASIGRGIAWSIRKAESRGVPRSQLIIDPGLGFGKSRRQNFQILARLGRLRRFELPIMVGASRKSFLQAVVAGEGLDPQPKRGARPGSSGEPASLWIFGKQSPSGMSVPLLIGNAAATAAAVLGGAHIVRVHDVAATLPAVRVADAILASLKSED